MDAVSQFGSLGCTVLRSAEASGGERDDKRAARSVVAPGGDLQLIYVRHFLCDAGEGTIPERVF